MAARIKGESHLAAAFTGEGSTAEADFHHAMTFAAVYKAPVLVSVVNNQWAISTFQGTAGGEHQTFAARGPGYGMPGIRVDGNDVLAVYAVSQWAAERARAGHGATLIEFVTYRAGAHSTSDDPSRYRPKEEGLSFPLGDPIARLRDHLIALGAWSSAQQEQLENEVAAHVDASWKEALTFGTMHEGPRLDPATLFDQVFKTPTPALERQRARFLATRTAESR
jgi:2-oxoisovalerate dehydrogenase E1 component alpha subunit